MDESGTGLRLDIPKILSDVHHRWLRPSQVCDILRNYRSFHISPEAPNNPASGSVFLFDRKVLRYFRKDGHNWRKKKDGKTVKEAHEKLKVGSIDMLHCYYAHGEDNENFQRRSYWLLEQDLMHMVFVHYLEVQGNMANVSYARKNSGASSSSGKKISISSRFCGTSPTSPLSSAHEDAESESNHHASSEFCPYSESPLSDDCHYAYTSSYDPPLTIGNQSVFGMTHGSLLLDEEDEKFSVAASADLDALQEVSGKSLAGIMSYKQESTSSSHENWQGMNRLFPDTSLPCDEENGMELCNMYVNQKGQHVNLKVVLCEEIAETATRKFENSMEEMRSENFSLLLKKTQLGVLKPEESLKKVDSFCRWMDKELGEENGLATRPSSGISWSIIGSEYESNMPVELQLDIETLSPSISQDQLYSITDFSPHWAYSNQETKVLVAGIFLKGGIDVSQSRWSIMFGQLEVPAEVLGDGIICCRAPLQDPGLFPFYVTCSNRLACSEIREFEYRAGLFPSSGSVESDRGRVALMHLYQRFEMMLCMESPEGPLTSIADDFDEQTVSLKIISLRDEENILEENLTSVKDTLCHGELLLEKKLKNMCFSWFLRKGGKGITVFDEGGQSVLHLAAALGFTWAFQPFIVSGVTIDFRDVNGWTALHWAAFYGREDAVAALVSLGAGPGLLTDPSAKYPLGRTPADLASFNGHKGISGFLAETSLTRHLSTLTVNIDGTTAAKAYKTLPEHVAAPNVEEDVSDKLLLRDSLAAICNATQAAAQIHQIFRFHSFQRKQFSELDSDLEEQAISLVAGKSSRFSNSLGRANSAAIQIQKKYRGWKKRKEFLLIRRKVVKIQAHIRGHQVRKKYKTIVWSVGIMEKVILRWRRKRSGLRGFRQNKVQTERSFPSLEDDYEVLKQGRKQTEERMQKALDRVKSMAQYPEARAQYRRLLNAAEGFREAKDASCAIISDTDELMGVASMLDDETFISLTFQ